MKERKKGLAGSVGFNMYIEHFLRPAETDATSARETYSVTSFGWV